MIGYVCKYAPVEVLAGFSLEAKQIVPMEDDVANMEPDIHQNVCSYAKAILSAAKRGNYEMLLLTDCCDALKRVTDTLTQNTDIEIYRMNLPRANDEGAMQLYAGEIKKFIQYMVMNKKLAFDMEKFVETLRQGVGAEADDHLGVFGASVPGWMLDMIAGMSTVPVRNYTCTRPERAFANVLERDDTKPVIDWYAEQLLTQTPCMRMHDVEGRKAQFEDQKIVGGIYHTIKFCDFYEMEYSALETQMPLIRLETDYSRASEGQVRTRLQAFLESNGWLKTADARPQEPLEAGAVDAPAVAEERQDAGVAASKSYFAGVDSGSTTTNVVILDDEGNVRGMSSVPTGGKVDQSAKKALGAALAQAKIMPMNVKYIVSTGYGRSALRWPDKDITEITCHAKGAHQLYPEAATVIDIGGQDSKIIQLDGDGGVGDFMMNDKCAAGTGRFLEMMANTLDITMEEFIAAGLEWNEDIVISSMCAVFAESEVVSLIAQEKALADIVHGLNNSVAKRVINMIARQGADGPYVMTGGVAKNNGVANALSEALHEEVLIPRNPEYCGAFGAAHFALELGK